jgi:hypothetical protein
MVSGPKTSLARLLTALMTQTQSNAWSRMIHPVCRGCSGQPAGSAARFAIPASSDCWPHPRRPKQRFYRRPANLAREASSATLVRPIAAELARSRDSLHRPTQIRAWGRQHHYHQQLASQQSTIVDDGKLTEYVGSYRSTGRTRKLAPCGWLPTNNAHCAARRAGARSVSSTRRSPGNHGPGTSQTPSSCRSPRSRRPPGDPCRCR